MANERIGIGFIGAGGIAKQRHLPGLSKVPGVELVSVANRHRESGEAVAREWGFGKVEDDWRKVLDDPNVDAVFIAAPPLLHKEATLAALQAGKHVFCQARMARNYAEAKEMYDASQKTQLRTMLCPPPHGMPSDYLVKRLLKEGYVGKPLEVHVYGLLNTYTDPNAPLHWRQDSEISGLNTLFLGMYVEVVHRWLGYNKRVAAITRVHTPKRQRPGTNEMVDVKIADSVAFSTEMENGAVGSYHIAGTSLHPQPNRCEIHGSEGTLIVSLGTDAVGDVRGAKRGEEIHPIEITDSERRVWAAEEEFIRAIREGGPVSPDFTEGLKYMEMTEAIYRSSAENKIIELPLDRVAVGAR